MNLYISFLMLSANLSIAFSHFILETTFELFKNSSLKKSLSFVFSTISADKISATQAYISSSSKSFIFSKSSAFSLDFNSSFKINLFSFL